MQILPAIDIFQGQCVRLTQGLFTERTDYGLLPADVARSFFADGAGYLHVVDLEGAKEGKVVNWDSIAAVAAVAGARMEIGGGVSTDDDVARLMDLGVGRVVVGSVALRSPELLDRWLGRYGAGKICVALDVNDGKIAYAGWQTVGEEDIAAAASRLIDGGARIFLSTDIARDGRLAGPNVPLYRTLVRDFPTAQWLASGGVHSIGDIDALVATGVAGAVIGKALYEGTLKLPEILRRVC
jgi:phosphoribosylformimino-5-aminoimidazole carboxamide ribotide isomerase